MVYILIGVLMLGYVLPKLHANFFVRDRWPAGRRFTHTYKGYKAVVIIDNKTKYANGYFHYDEYLISGPDLAKACALGMYVTNWIWDAYEFPKPYHSDSNVRECIYTFLEDEAFNEASRAVGHRPSKILAFAIKFMDRNPYDGPYGCVIKAKELKNSEVWAATPIHEYVHAMTHYHLNDWDHAHAYWAEPYLDDEDKSIAIRAAEQTYIILNIG